MDCRLAAQQVANRQTFVSAAVGGVTLHCSFARLVCTPAPWLAAAACAVLLPAASAQTQVTSWNLGTGTNPTALIVDRDGGPGSASPAGSVLASDVNGFLVQLLPGSPVTTGVATRKKWPLIEANWNSLAVTPADVVFVRTTNFIQRIDLNTNVRTTWQVNFGYGDCTVDAQGNLWFAATTGSVLCRLTPAGATGATVTRWVVGPQPGADIIQGVRVNPATGLVYFASFSGSTSIGELNPATNQQRRWTINPAGAQNPLQIDIDSAGDVVWNSYSNRLGRLRPTTNELYRRILAGPVSGYGYSIVAGSGLLAFCQDSVSPNRISTVQAITGPPTIVAPVVNTVPVSTVTQSGGSGTVLPSTAAITPFTQPSTDVVVGDYVGTPIPGAGFMIGIDRDPTGPSETYYAADYVTNRIVRITRGPTNRPPTVTCPLPPPSGSFECNSPNQDGLTPLTLTAQVADPDGNPMTVKWSVDSVLQATQTGVPNGPASFTFNYAHGAHTIGVSVSDGTAPAVTCGSTVNLVDTTAPTIVVADLVEVPTDEGQCYATNVTLGQPHISDNCEVASLTNDAPAQFPHGSTIVTWTVRDDAGNSASAGQEVRVSDQEPPTLTPPPTVTVLTDPGQCSATNVNLGTPEAQDNCEVASLTNNAPAIFPHGLTAVLWTATDGAGNSTTRLQSVIVQDKEAPQVTCSVLTASLWPPNHDLVAVGLKVTATDNCDAAPVVTVAVYADEDDETPTGDGNHSPDAKDAASGTLRLRAERKGDADGRVYLIVATATDADGNVGRCCSTVVVPKSQSPAHLSAAAAQAAAAKAACEAGGGAPPAGFVPVGEAGAPVNGPKQ